MEGTVDNNLKNPVENNVLQNSDTSAFLSTAIPGLDIILNGGPTRDRLYLVEGEPRTGRTTLAMQFLNEGARLGESVVYITLAETSLELRYVEMNGAVQQAISVFKKRRSLHERTIRHFALDADGIQVGAVLKGFHGILSGMPSLVVPKSPATA
ncbi:MAG: hypothetical protein H7244_01740, partial [Herminiimonas sp.]|nr:hypothetical protein [Herminiimonas sp.]